jgi:threonine synthase
MAMREAQLTTLIDRYRDRLPVSETTPVVSLGEGSTPLIRAERISDRLGIEVWLKLELANPTGSFMDRGMTVAMSKAVEEGAGAVAVASTGNTASSAAAYAARAGLPAVVLTAQGTAGAKVAQARMYGARVVEVRGSFDQALTAALELEQRGTHVLVNSLNPYRIEGQKTVAFEIVDALGTAPDALVLPYGGGGNTRAVFRGFEELGVMPRLLPVQAAAREDTLASAIRIAAPVHADEVAEAVGRSDGRVVTVGDDEIVRAWQSLALEEGIFCEPSSAASLAGLERVALPSGSSAVCIVTGHGLKDPALPAEHAPQPISVDPDLQTIQEATR